MQNFIKTIINGVQNWTKKEIKNSTADWNQNDSSAANYVKNRTHYIDENAVILPEFIFGGNRCDIKLKHKLLESATYKICFNDYVYECSLYRFEFLDKQLSLGNVIIALEDMDYPVELGKDTGEPFYIGYDEIEQSIRIINRGDTSDTNKISIIGDAVIKKLDDFYLPENIFTPYYAFNFGLRTTASGDNSHAEGYETTASGYTSHTEGFRTTASGDSSHAEGHDTIASGSSSHAEGCSTAATMSGAHSEGFMTRAEFENAHAEGYNTIASGWNSHSEGMSTVASGNVSHAEGQGTVASGQCSHAEGENTTAQCRNQHVQGEYNILDSVGDTSTRGAYTHIVGNGTSDTARSNAHTLDWNGVGWFQGGLQVGGNAQDDGAKNVLLEGDAIPVPATAQVGQVLSVKAVDENGVPAAWETTDISTSGGSDCVVSDTAPEDTSVLWIDTSDNSSDENLGGGNVAYDEVQNLSDEQKAQARENIGAQPKGNYLTEHQSLEGYAKTEDIPTDEHINSLINTALGVIENGTY